MHSKVSTQQKEEAKYRVGVIIANYIHMTRGSYSTYVRKLIFLKRAKP